jgi:thymidylate synthase
MIAISKVPRSKYGTIKRKEDTMRFQDSKEFIIHLEQHAQDYSYLHEIADIFKALTEGAVELGNENEVKICECEEICFYFMDHDGGLGPMFKGTDESGKHISYPDVNSLSDDQISYVLSRLQASINCILRARYSHVLWGVRKASIMTTPEQP